jgi:hypothetical protein
VIQVKGYSTVGDSLVAREELSKGGIIEIPNINIHMAVRTAEINPCRRQVLLEP